MAYKRWESENSLYSDFEYKPEILNFFAEQAIQSKFYHYYQFCHTDSTSPVGISALSICYCPYFNKAINPNAAYIDHKFRGLDFYKEFYKIMSKVIAEEKIGVLHVSVNYSNDIALFGRKASRV